MEKFAKAVKRAAEIRENSYSREKAEKMRQQRDKGEIFFADYKQCYTKTIQQAADEAAAEMGFDERGTEPIYLLLTCCWNDALGWAEQFED